LEYVGCFPVKEDEVLGQKMIVVKEAADFNIEERIASGGAAFNFFSFFAGGDLF
jgi:hypothetical protein